MEFGLKFFIKSILLGGGLAMDAFSVSLADGLNEPDMSKKKSFLIAGVFTFFQALMPLIGWICVQTISIQFKAFEKAIPYIALILLGFIGGKMVFEFIKEYKRKPKREKLINKTEYKSEIFKTENTECIDNKTIFNDVENIQEYNTKNIKENKIKNSTINNSKICSAENVLIDCAKKNCVTLENDESNSSENNTVDSPKKLTVGALILQGIATSIDALSVGFTISDYDLFRALICALIIAVVTFGICFSGILLGKKFGTIFAGKATLLGGLILIAIGLEIFISGII